MKLPLSVPLACDEALQDLALLIHGPPEMVSPCVDLHEGLVEAFAQIDKEEIDPILSITTKAA